MFIPCITPIDYLQKEGFHLHISLETWLVESLFDNQSNQIKDFKLDWSKIFTWIGLMIRDTPLSCCSVFTFFREEMVFQWNWFFPHLISRYQKTHYCFLEIAFFPVFQETTLPFFDFQLPILLLLEVLWSLSWSRKNLNDIMLALQLIIFYRTSVSRFSLRHPSHIFISCL